MTAFTLIALQVVLSTPLAGLAGAAALPAQWARQWMDPAVPLIPDRQAPAASPGGGSTVNTKLPPGSQGNTSNPGAGAGAKKG